MFLPQTSSWLTPWPSSGLGFNVTSQHGWHFLNNPSKIWYPHRSVLLISLLYLSHFGYLLTCYIMHICIVFPSSIICLLSLECKLQKSRGIFMGASFYLLFTVLSAALRTVIEMDYAFTRLLLSWFCFMKIVNIYRFLKNKFYPSRKLLSFQFRRGPFHYMESEKEKNKKRLASPSICSQAIRTGKWCSLR